MIGDYWVCDERTLKYDEACVNLRSEDKGSKIWLYWLSTDCSLCPFTKIKQVTENVSSLTLDTVRPSIFRLLNTTEPEEFESAKNTNNVICELMPNLGQFGVYNLTVRNGKCEFEVLNQPTYPYTELFVAIVLLVLGLFGLSGLKWLWYLYKQKFANKIQVEESAAERPVKHRVKAIDTVRGACTLLMIFVNDGSGGYSILGHATWDGLLFGDLLFPCFMWIMGVCIPIAIRSQLKRMVPKHVVWYGILKRSVLLFLIGLSLNTVVNGAQLETIRIFGVLQRFSLTYLVVATIYLLNKPTPQLQFLKINGAQDICLFIPSWLIMISIAIFHCTVTFGLKIPGCPYGYLGPGGLHHDGKYMDCVGGAAGYIDRIVLTYQHLHHSNSIYMSKPFDPEGILGFLTSSFQVFLGMHAGIIMMTYKDWKERLIRWMAWAAFFACIGCALHFSDAIPINKKLWSLSFVFATTSFSLAFLSACYLLIDVLKVWNGGPFRIPGMNALLLYVGHMLCYQIFPFHWGIGKVVTRSVRLCESIWGVGLWTVIAYVMHQKRIYISL